MIFRSAGAIFAVPVISTSSMMASLISRCVFCINASPDSKGTLISPKFLGEHFALLRFAVDHIQSVHCAVADIGDQVDAFQSGGEARNGGVAPADRCAHRRYRGGKRSFVDKFHLGVLHRYALKICLLPACPGQRQTGGKSTMCASVRFSTFSLLGDGCKGQHIIVLVLDFVRCKFLCAPRR